MWLLDKLEQIRWKQGFISISEMLEVYSIVVLVITWIVFAVFIFIDGGWIMESQDWVRRNVQCVYRCRFCGFEDENRQAVVIHIKNHHKGYWDFGPVAWVPKTIRHPKIIRSPVCQWSGVLCFHAYFFIKTKI